MQTHSGAYLKNHSRNLHTPLCGIFPCHILQKKYLPEPFPVLGGAAFLMKGSLTLQDNIFRKHLQL